MEEVAKIGKRLAIGDYNTHNLDWSLKIKRDNRATQLREGMVYLSLNVEKDCFLETFRRGDQQKSRIDLTRIRQQKTSPDIASIGVASPPGPLQPQF